MVGVPGRGYFDCVLEYPKRGNTTRERWTRKKSACGPPDAVKLCVQIGWRRRRWRQQQQGPGAVVFAVGLKGRVFDNDDYDGRRDCDFQVHLHPSSGRAPLPLARRRFHGCSSRLAASSKDLHCFGRT